MKNKTIFFWSTTKNINVASFRMRCKYIVDHLDILNVKVIFGTQIEDNIDILVLSKRYDPLSIKTALILKNKNNTLVLFDLCDNHFVLVDKRKQLIAAINSVDVIICSSIYLSKIIRRNLNINKSVHVIEDIVEKVNQIQSFNLLIIHKYFYNYLKFNFLKFRLNFITKEKKNRFIWFGNHEGSYNESGMKDILIIKESLEHLKKYENNISLTILSNSRKKYNEIFKDWEINTLYSTWNKMYFSKILKLHHTSLIPVNKNDFTYSKSENRLTTSLAHKLNVIADPVPAYIKFFNYAYIGNWDQSLKICLNSNDIKNSTFDYIKYNDDILYKWNFLFTSLLNEKI